MNEESKEKDDFHPKIGRAPKIDVFLYIKSNINSYYNEIIEKFA